MRKNVIKRSLMVLMTVIVTTVFCTAAASAASVKVISKANVYGMGVYEYKYNTKGQLIKIRWGRNNHGVFSYKSGRPVKYMYVQNGKKGTVNYKYDKKHRLYESVDSMKGWKRTIRYYYKKSHRRPYRIKEWTTGNSCVTFDNISWSKFNLPTKWTLPGYGTDKAAYNKKGYKIRGPEEQYTYKYQKNKIIQNCNGLWNRTNTFKTIKVKTKKQAKAAKKAQYLIVENGLPIITTPS